MAGIVNDYLIYPILDLIRQEIKAAQQGEQRESGGGAGGGGGGGGGVFLDPFGGYPSVQLFRNHPRDTSKVLVSGATLLYESGYSVEIDLQYASTSWRLYEVYLQIVDPQGASVVAYAIRLSYDERGLINHTQVQRR